MEGAARRPTAHLIRTGLGMFLLAGLSLMIGLLPSALRIGRLEPLDWILPGYCVLVVLILLAGLRRRAGDWLVQGLAVALVVLPPLLVIGMAGATFRWLNAILFAGAMTAFAPLICWLSGRRRWVRWAALLFCAADVAGLLYLNRVVEGFYIQAAGPRGGVVTALPIYGPAKETRDVLEMGQDAPLVEALMLMGNNPLAEIDDATLAGLDVLLLAQPRLLRPRELVTLDAWVRRGGRVVILADPFLQWPDERPLHDPARAPLTSLLDPLLSHWGLTLEPAKLDKEDPVERRILSDGKMLQLAGASRFTLAEGAPCRLAEQGLIARCAIGKGSALLVADADFADDRLWTASPDNPEDRRDWTSDAVPLLRHWLYGEIGEVRPSGAWLLSNDALVGALRWAFALVTVLSAMLAWREGQPRISHPPPGTGNGTLAPVPRASPESGG